MSYDGGVRLAAGVIAETHSPTSAHVTIIETSATARGCCRVLDDGERQERHYHEPCASRPLRAAASSGLVIVRGRRTGPPSCPAPPRRCSSSTWWKLEC